MNRIILAATFIFMIPFTACSDKNSASNAANNIPPQTDTVVAADKGQVLFEAKCASCHGSDGTAGIGNAANLHLSKLDTGSIAKIVASGRNAMPSFKDQLSEDELHKLASYVYTLRQ